MLANINLTPVEIASYASAGALALSKAFTFTRPYWTKLPPWLRAALPVLVLDLPQVAAYFGACTQGTCTSVSLLTAAMTSVALLLPGIEHAESAGSTTTVQTTGAGTQSVTTTTVTEKADPSLTGTSGSK